MKIQKNIQIIALLTFIPFMLASCGEKKNDAETSGSKPYPLKTCLVSGEKLSSMGEDYVFVHEGQQIKMCCKKCLKKFTANPTKYLAMLEKAKTGADPHDHSGHDHSGHNH